MHIPHANLTERLNNLFLLLRIEHDTRGVTLTGIPVPHRLTHFHRLKICKSSYFPVISIVYAKGIWETGICHQFVSDVSLGTFYPSLTLLSLPLFSLGNFRSQSPKSHRKVSFDVTEFWVIFKGCSTWFMYDRLYIHLCSVIYTPLCHLYNWWDNVYRRLLYDAYNVLLYLCINPIVLLPTDADACSIISNANFLL